MCGVEVDIPTGVNVEQAGQMFVTIVCNFQEVGRGFSLHAKKVAYKEEDYEGRTVDLRLSPPGDSGQAAYGPE